MKVRAGFLQRAARGHALPSSRSHGGGVTEILRMPERPGPQGVGGGGGGASARPQEECLVGEGGEAGMNGRELLT